MKKNYFLHLCISLLLILSSCSNDDNNDNSGTSEGQMTASINGVNTNFNVSAISYQGVTTKNEPYDYLIISGTQGTGANASSFAVYVYAQKITAKAYPVPNFQDTSSYNYLQGFSQGIYIPNVTLSNDYYYSFMIAHSSGSVIVNEVTDTNIKGTYDMTLINSLDTSKNMTLNGEFNAKIMTINHK